MPTPQPTYEPIATITLPSDQTSIIFAGIPQTYTDLVCEFIGRSSYSASAGDALFIRVNEDSRTLYSKNRAFDATPSTAGGNFETDASTADIVRMENSSSGNTINGFAEIHFFNYNNTSFKIIYGHSAIGATDTGALVNHGTCFYRGTLPITQIKLYSAQGGDMKSGATATLYGIKRNQ